jgi:hypothetical protein
MLQMIRGPDHFHEDGVVRLRKGRNPRAAPKLLTHVEHVAAAVATLRPVGNGDYVGPLHRVMQAVSAVTGVSVNDMLSPRRARRSVDARFVYYAVAVKATTASLVQIGRRCGDRDHSTVINGLKVVKYNPDRYGPAIDAAEAMLK